MDTNDGAAWSIIKAVIWICGVSLGPLSQFPLLLAAGTSISAAASPCGWTQTLFLQLKVQLKRIHNALMHEEVNRKKSSGGYNLQALKSIT